MRYKSKPVIIEAIEWAGDNLEEIKKFVGDEAEKVFTYGPAPGTKDDILLINTLEGQMTASNGDFIIKGTIGEFYPCKPEVFNAKYEKVEDL